jgi:hypothetical protein
MKDANLTLSSALKASVGARECFGPASEAALAWASERAGTCMYVCVYVCVCMYVCMYVCHMPIKHSSNSVFLTYLHTTYNICVFYTYYTIQPIQHTTYNICSSPCHAPSLCYCRAGPMYGARTGREQEREGAAGGAELSR